MSSFSPEYLRGAADALAAMAKAISTLIDRDDKPECCTNLLHALRSASSTACLMTEMEGVDAHGA